MEQKLEFCDVTPRDGEQMSGMNLTAENKIEIAKIDDELKIDIVELGFPESNITDRKTFKALKKLGLQTVLPAAFGMTRRKDNPAENDAGLRALIECKAPVITVVGKASREHVETILKTDLAANRRMIYETLSYLRTAANPKRLIFDAEHFFDGFKEKPRYALDVIGTAIEGGADTVVLCDTNGGSMPEEIHRGVAFVRNLFQNIKVGIHCHNDEECAVANTYTAVLAGAEHVQGTWNGYGERCGNASLFSVIPILKSKGFSVPDTTNFTQLSVKLDELARQYPIQNRPFVGSLAFAHKGGMHGKAVSQWPGSYEHIKPESVGNERKIECSKLAGIGIVRTSVTNAKAISQSAKDRILNDDELQRKILEEIEKSDSDGSSIGIAPASFELLILSTIEEFHPKIHELKNPLIHDEIGGKTEATVKIKINGEKGEPMHVVSEGDGPLGALNNALMKAMKEKYPELNKLHLADYRSVKLPKDTKEANAKVQVIAIFSDGESTWSTTGVSADSTQAGWIAFKDAVEYMLLKNRH